MKSSKVVEIIKEVNDHKARCKIKPAHALIVKDVIPKAAEHGISKQDALSEIDRLVKERVIKQGRTINDDFIKLI